MKAALLGRITRLLGWLFLFGMVFDLTIGARSVMAPICAAMAVPLLVNLVAHAPVPKARWWLAWTPAAGIAAFVLAVAPWLTDLDRGGARASMQLVAFAGAGAYALGLAHWLQEWSWDLGTRMYRRAGRALLSVAGLMTVSFAYLLAATPVRPRPAGTFEQERPFGHVPPHGPLWGVVVAAGLMGTIVALWWLRKANSISSKALQADRREAAEPAAAPAEGVGPAPAAGAPPAPR